MSCSCISSETLLFCFFGLLTINLLLAEVAHMYSFFFTAKKEQDNITQISQHHITQSKKYWLQLTHKFDNWTEKSTTKNNTKYTIYINTIIMTKHKRKPWQ